MKTLTILRTIAAFVALGLHLRSITPEQAQQTAEDFVCTTQAFLSDASLWSTEPVKSATMQLRTTAR